MFEILDPKSPKRVPPNLCALGIMTKAPQPGKVKTRLSPPLTPDEAAELNACFLRDLAASLSKASAQSPARGVAVYTPVGAETAYEKILPKDFFLIPQRGQEFGERLYLAAEDLFASGFESVCLINSDSPAVAASSFAEAANVLSKTGEQLVIGPSSDGGYYLIGFRRNDRRFFERIDWSTERVLEQTRQRARDIGIGIHELPIGSDVDDASGLRQLCDELLNSSDGPEIAANTTQFLRSILEREGRQRIWPV